MRYIRRELVMRNIQRYLVQPKIFSARCFLAASILQRQESNDEASKGLGMASLPQFTHEPSTPGVNRPPSPPNAQSLGPPLQEKSLTHEVLQVVEQKISPLVEQVIAMKEMERTKYLNCHYHDTHASESSSIGQNTIVGFDRYLTTIKDQLSGQSSQLQVITITGTGGIGKTMI